MPNPPIPPWATAVAAAYAQVARSVVLSDLGACQPAGALAQRLRPQAWKLMDYELADGTQGRLVWAPADADAPELTLPMGPHGPHAVFVGLFAGGLPCSAWLRLESEPVPQVRSVTKGTAWNQIEEVFFEVANLDGSGLCLSQDGEACGVAWVRLVPLDQHEAAVWGAERAAPRPRRQAATHDGLGILYGRPAAQATAAHLRRSLEGFRRSGFGTLLLQYGGVDQVPYPSARGCRFGAATEPRAYPENPGHRLWDESYRAFAARALNPYRILIDAAHDLDMAVHVSVRPALWTFWEPYADFFESPFYREHPEWRTIDRDGTPVTRLSWAVPEVRQHVLAVVQEAVALGADGANVLFNRGMPVVLYEPAFAALFQQQHGLDPHQVAEGDARLVQTRADIIAAFMRQLREQLDREGQSRSTPQRLVLSASCFGNGEDNLHFGLDIRRLVEEGLLDEVYPYKWDHLNGAPRRQWDIAYFAAFCQPRGVRLSPVLTAGYEFETQAHDALGFYEQGADSISYWDPAGTWRDMRQWSAMARMDRPDELRARCHRGPEPEPVRRPLHRVNEQVVDGRYPPYMGG